MSDIADALARCDAAIAWGAARRAAAAIARCDAAIAAALASSDSFAAYATAAAIAIADREATLAALATRTP